ncbi:MAG: hypothetical protein IJI68_13895 [Eggerthellaceae bacterium]|nr:hypothetical protein [Eggerthellaceae bacterium]
MRLVSLVCPRCNANLESIRLEDGVNTLYCNYCGTKIALQDENQITYRQVDAARIKEAEVSEAIRMKELEMEEHRREDQKKRDALMAKTAIFLAALGFLMMIAGYALGSVSGDSNSSFYMLALLGFFPFMGAAFIGLHFLFGDERKRKD